MVHGFCDPFTSCSLTQYVFLLFGVQKALLKTDILQCEDLTNDESDDCVLEVILREIVNNQNFQIQTMQSVLDEAGYPQTDDCKVEIAPLALTSTPPPSPQPTSSARGMATGMILASVVALVCLYSL